MRWNDIENHEPLEEYVSLEKHIFKKTALYQYLETNNMPFSKMALDLAGQYHTGLRKDGKTPEIDHQVSISRYLLKFKTNMMYPDETIASALLHDLSEDYNFLYGDIKKYFGGRISRAVVLLTKEYFGVKRVPEIYFSQITSDPIASIVKGADRVHNVHTIQAFKPAKKIEYTDETRDWIIPCLLEAKENFPKQASIYDKMVHILGYKINNIVKGVEGIQNDK